MLEPGVGGRAANECSCLVDILRVANACSVVKERVIGNLKEPRAEPALVLIASTGKVSFDQRFLCKIVCIVLFTTAEGEQEAS